VVIICRAQAAPPENGPGPVAQEYLTKFWSRHNCDCAGKQGGHIVPLGKLTIIFKRKIWDMILQAISKPGYCVTLSVSEGSRLLEKLDSSLRSE